MLKVSLQFQAYDDRGTVVAVYQCILYCCSRKKNNDVILSNQRTCTVEVLTTSLLFSSQNTYISVTITL